MWFVLFSTITEMGKQRYEVVNVRNGPQETMPGIIILYLYNKQGRTFS